MGDGGYQREAERDIQAGIEMARFLLSLPGEEFEQFKAQGLHIIPIPSWRRLTPAERAEAERKGMESKGDDYQTHNGRSIDELQLSDDEADQPDSFEGESVEVEQEQVDHECVQDARVWLSVREAVEMVVAAENARLEALCLKLNAGLAELDGVTVQSVSSRHEISEREIIANCTRQAETLGLESQRKRPKKGRTTVAAGEYVMTETEQAWFAIRKVVDLIVSKPNARLEAECFLLSSGLCADDKASEAELGRKYGITRAGVSKRCKAQISLLGLKPSRYMRAFNMCEKYRKARYRSLRKRSAA